MSRSRQYTRSVRENSIKRKKQISKSVYGIDWYRYDGSYSKGKIHCGCGLCKFGKKYKLPLYYELKDREYVKLIKEDLFS